MTRSHITHIEHLARRKAIYEALHPETRKGVSQATGMNRKLGNNVTEIISATFAEDTAAKTGFTPRTIRHEVQIATRIPDDVRELLRSTPVAERSPRPTLTPSAPPFARATTTRQNGAHGAITARDRLPHGEP